MMAARRAPRRSEDADGSNERPPKKSAKEGEELVVGCAVCGQVHAAEDEHLYIYADEASIGRELVDAITALPIVDCVHLPCQHAFSRKSLRKWLQLRDSCPTCRSPVSASDLEHPSPRIIRSLLDNLKVLEFIFLPGVAVVGVIQKEQ